MPDSTSIFPCWGRHSRMGHNVIIGHFEPFAGTSVICRVPELPADPETFKLARPASVHIVPMEGPAFFGFDLLSESTAMGLLLLGRATDWEAQEEARRVKRLTDSSMDAEEVPRRYAYSPADCPSCEGQGRSDGKGGGCPDCGEIPF